MPSTLSVNQYYQFHHRMFVLAIKIKTTAKSRLQTINQTFVLTVPDQVNKKEPGREYFENELQSVSKYNNLYL